MGSTTSDLARITGLTVNIDSIGQRHRTQTPKPRETIGEADRQERIYPYFRVAFRTPSPFRSPRPCQVPTTVRARTRPRTHLGALPQTTSGVLDGHQNNLYSRPEQIDMRLSGSTFTQATASNLVTLSAHSNLLLVNHGLHLP